MKRVVEFVSSMNEGGAETLVKDYALLCDSKKVEIIVLTIYPPSVHHANYRLLNQAGKEVISIYHRDPVFKNKILYSIWYHLFHQSYVIFRLRKILSELRPDCIHVHLELLHFLKPLSKMLQGTKLFYTCHSKPSRYFNDTNRKNELQAARLLITRNNLRIIALHSKMQSELNELFGIDNTIVVPNGVKFSNFLIPDTKNEIRRQLGIPEESFVVGHVGRFSYMKNHAFLVDVFVEILKNRPDAFLFMVGDGDKKENTIDKLHNLGLDDKYLILSHRTDVPRLLKAMDVFVFPSTFEGLPVSVVEAQIANLRCVISDAVTDECFFGKDAVPFSLSRKASEWADAILSESYNGPYRNDINNFDMDNVMRKLENLYI